MKFTFKVETFSQKLTALFTGFIVLALSLSIYGYNGHSDWPPIKLEGQRYYSYLTTLIIHKSTEFTNIKKKGEADRTGESLNKSKERLDNKYPIGTAILIGPFFLIAHFITLLFDSVNADGYSLIYQVSVLIAGYFYYLLGSLVLAKYLRHFFGEKEVFFTIIFITFGTSLFHYATLDSAFPHVYSYCLVSLYFYFTEKFWKSPNLTHSLTLGLIIGLLFLVENLNLIFISFFLFYPCGKDFKNRVLVNIKPLSLVVMTVIIVIIPQCIIWKTNGSSFFLDSPGGNTFNFLNPSLIETVASIQSGVFIWSPALLLGVIGLLLTLRGELKKIATLSLINLFILTYIIASYKEWHLGGGYGHRGFISAYPFFAIGIAALLSELKKISSKKTALVVLGGFTLLTSIQMFNYWKGKIDYIKPTWAGYYRALTNFPRLVFVELLPKRMKSLTSNNGLFAKGAIIIPHQKEIQVRAEATFIIKVMIKNKGYSFWLPPKRDGNLHGSVALGGQWYQKKLLKTCNRPHFPPVLESRIRLWDIVSPNEWVHFEDFIKVPKKPGNYYYMLGLVSEKVAWFDQISNSFLKCIEVEVRPKTDKFRSFFPRTLNQLNH